MDHPDRSARCSATCGITSRVVTAGHRDDIGLAATGALAARRCAAYGNGRGRGAQA